MYNDNNWKCIRILHVKNCRYLTHFEDSRICASALCRNMHLRCTCSAKAKSEIEKEIKNG